MRRTCLFLLPLLLPAGIALHAQETWKRITNYDGRGGPALTALAFPDSNTILVTTSAMYFKRSVDAGKTWEEVTYFGDSNTYMNGVSFADSKNGAVAGDAGGVAFTFDGGMTWTMHPAIGFRGIFRAVANPAPGIAICAGDSGVVMATRDGGLTWTRGASPVSTQLTSVSFPDTTVGYCAGLGGVILKSTDLGRTWTQLSSNTPHDLLSLHFSDRRHGYAAAERVVMKTTDGGDTWTPEAGQGQALCFIDSATGIIATRNLLYRTGDASRTWTEVSSESAWTVGASPIQMRAVGFGSPRFGMAVGDFGAMLLTRDGGRTWFMRAGAPNGAKPHSMSFPSPVRGYLAGTEGSVMRTDDSGTTWHRTITPTRAPVVGAHFWTLDSGVAVTSDAQFVRTSDAGAAWSVDRIPGGFKIRAFAFRDAVNGFLVGENGVVLRTRDGGVTWTQQWSGTRNHLNAIGWADSACAVAAGEFGVILCTTDGGDRWQVVTTGVYPHVSSLTITDASTVYASGYQALCLRSRDAGATWEYLDIPKSNTPTPGLAIAFADAAWGIIGRDMEGSILETTDGARSWQPRVISGYFSLAPAVRSACFPSPLSGFFGLNDGNIYRAIRGRPAAPRLSVSSDAIGFGKAPEGAVRMRRLWLANTGGAAMTAPDLSIIGPDAPEFSVTGDVLSPLPADGSRRPVDILWHAGREGVKGAVLHIAATNAEPRTTEISLTAETVNPLWTANATRLQYGEAIIGSDVDRTLVLTLNGVAPLPPPVASLVGADASQFSVISATPGLVQPGTNAVLTVRFHPAQAGRTVTAWMRFNPVVTVAPLETISLEGFATVASHAADHPMAPVAFLGAPYPQPAAAVVTIPLSLAARAHLRLALFDALGRRVALLRNDDTDAGAHAFPIDTRAFTPGVYGIVAEIGGALRLTQRITVLR